MRSKLTKFLTLLFLTAFSVTHICAQSCVPTSINGTVVNIACPQTCANLSFQIPHVKNSSDYLVRSIPYNPYPYVTPAGVEQTTLYDDDVFSSVIPLPFSFCFYGDLYNKCVIGSNGLVTFDILNAGLENSWALTTIPHGNVPQPIPYAGGVQDDISTTYYPKASIMGAYHDIYPVLTAAGSRRIEYSIVGNAPCRKFVVSFFNVPMYSCNNDWASSQIVMH